MPMKAREGPGRQLLPWTQFMSGSWGVSAGIEEGQRQQQEGSWRDSFSISADIALAAATGHSTAEIGSCCLDHWFHCPM